MTWDKKIPLKKIATIACIVLVIAGFLLAANKLIHYYSVRIFDVPEKYWYHGVNSPETLMEAGKYYAGLELDLIYHEQEKAYENSHDPVSLEKHNVSKTLDAYVLLGRKNKLWLDFKNLTEENMNSARMTLDALLNKYDIPKSRCIIEAKKHKALKDFKDNGYTVSYYYTATDKSNLQKDNDFLIKLSHSGMVDMISFDYKRHYKYINSLPLSKNIKLLTWRDRAKWLSFELNPIYRDLRNNPQIAVILAH